MYNKDGCWRTGAKTIGPYSGVKCLVCGKSGSVWSMLPITIQASGSTLGHVHKRCNHKMKGLRRIELDNETGLIKI